MRALLINGPRHLTTLNMADGAMPPSIVIPKPVEINPVTAALTMQQPQYPTFETIVYQIHLASAHQPIGGFVFYVAEEK